MIFSTTSSTSTVCRLFADGHSDWCEVLPLGRLDLNVYFLKACSNIFTLFYCFLSFSYYCVVFMYFEQQSFNWKYILHICSPLCPLPEIHQITSSEEGNFLILASFNLSIFPFMVSTPFQLHRTLAVPQ